MLARDQPTLTPQGSVSPCSSICVVTNFLSSLTSKPTLPCSTPCVSLHPDHSEGNRAQNRGWPHAPSGPTSKCRWLSSVQIPECQGCWHGYHGVVQLNKMKFVSCSSTRRCCPKTYMDLVSLYLHLPSLSPLCPLEVVLIWFWFEMRKRRWIRTYTT